jgi:hypothetical protein
MQCSSNKPYNVDTHIVKSGLFKKTIGGFQNYLCEVASRSATMIATHEPNEAHSSKDCISF